MALAPSVSITANAVGVTNTTDVYITANTAANINTAISQAGNTWRFTVFGFNTTTGEKVGNVKYNLRAGPGGNILDPVIATVTGKRDVGDSTTLGASFVLTVRSGLVTSNVVNVAVGGDGFGPSDLSTAVANVAVGSLGNANVILGVSFSGGDGYSNVIFTNATVEQLS